MRLKSLAVVLLISLPSAAQTNQPKWYKFSKTYVDQHFSADGSAIGSIRVSEMHPAKNVHPVECGGRDGELHIGVPSAAIANSAVSANAGQNSGVFGLVAEPPNVARGGTLFTNVESRDGKAASFSGYFRVWNEGHDVGTVYPSNPHHVLELHPAWGIRSAGFNYNRPSTVFPMKGYSGYGASRFRPLLSDISNWLRVAEDDRFVYVQMKQADNFYQLPVVVKEVTQIADGAGVAAKVDVYSDVAHQNLIYPDLTVIAAAKSRIASRLQANANWSTYLLGFFSINLHSAMQIASGHEGLDAAVPAPGALEFFAFGVPLEHAVSSSTPCTEEDD